MATDATVKWCSHHLEILRCWCMIMRHHRQHSSETCQSWRTLVTFSQQMVTEDKLWLVNFKKIYITRSLIWSSSETMDEQQVNFATFLWFAVFNNSCTFRPPGSRRELWLCVGDGHGGWTVLRRLSARRTWNNRYECLGWHLNLIY